MSPFGETMGTDVNSMVGLSIVVPLCWRRAVFEREGDEEDSVEVMSFFSKWPDWMSSITVRRVATREV